MIILETYTYLLAYLRRFFRGLLSYLRIWQTPSSALTLHFFVATDAHVTFPAAEHHRPLAGTRFTIPRREKAECTWQLRSSDVVCWFMRLVCQAGHAICVICLAYGTLGFSDFTSKILCFAGCFGKSLFTIKNGSNIGYKTEQDNGNT